MCRYNGRGARHRCFFIYCYYYYHVLRPFFFLPVTLRSEKSAPSTPSYTSPPPPPLPHSRQPSFVPPPGINFWDWHRPAPIRPGHTRKSSPPTTYNIYIYLHIIYCCTRPPSPECNVCRAINLSPDRKTRLLLFFFFF